MEAWREQLETFNKRVLSAETETNARVRAKELLEKSVQENTRKVNILMGSKELHKQAIAVLEKLSSDAIDDSFAFIESSLNEVLAKIFQHSPRKIKIATTIARQKIPELHIELYAANGIKRDLKEDSGHGIRQLISLLCIMCLICITGTRKFLVLDEVMSGLSKESRQAVNDILWSFTQVGFQFVIVEHGFIAQGAQVYRLELDNDVSRVVDSYIDQNGFFLDTDTKEKDDK